MNRLRISQETRVAYLFLIPAILFFALFMFYPIGYVFSMAFYRTNKLGILQEWAGFSNFVENMSKPEFWQITFRSFLWTFLAVAVKSVLGMIIALALNVQFFARKIARMLFIIGMFFILTAVFVERGIKLPFGRLPGDIIIRREKFAFYFPLTTGIIISIILTVIFTLLRKR